MFARVGENTQHALPSQVSKCSKCLGAMLLIIGIVGLAIGFGNYTLSTLKNLNVNVPNAFMRPIVSLGVSAISLYLIVGGLSQLPKEIAALIEEIC